MVLCQLCTPHKPIITGGGTTNQRQHVIRVHHAVAVADGIISTTKSTQASLDGHVVIAPYFIMWYIHVCSTIPSTIAVVYRRAHILT